MKTLLNLSKRVLLLNLFVFIIISTSSCEFRLPTIYNLNQTKIIPVHPKRLVVLSVDFLEYALTLGITPVAAPKEGGYIFLHPLPIQWQKIEEVGGSFGLSVNIEKILSLKPDLILAKSYQKDIYPLLSKIAPTIIINDLEGSVRD